MRDVIVVGGGVAGLTAATRLAAAGRDVLVVEARERLGGRIHTFREAGWRLPIELGAEFVHGRPPGLWPELHAAGARVAPVRDSHWLLHAGRLEDGKKEWERLQAALSQPPAKEEPFARRPLPRGLRELGRMYVEGFHAADPERVSARWLYEQQQAGADQSYRVLDGYDSLVRHFVASLSPAQIRLNAPVSRIEWRPGRVEVDGEAAQSAVITLPVSLLPRLTLSPRLREHEAAARALAMGAVVKVVLSFDHAWWHHHETELGPLSFVHDAQGILPTWWTLRPFDAPILVGWVGGPRAEILAGEAPQAVLRQAVASLARTLGERRERVAAALNGWLVKDWAADPWARGAYSWVPAGAMTAQQTLAQSVAETLFFAGEATDWEGASGTVHGAMRSGARAADEILAGEALAAQPR